MRQLSYNNKTHYLSQRNSDIMLDQFNRSIDYMRISITDACNLRCRYCMPEGGCPAAVDAPLMRAELHRICRAAASLGITKFKITGGEPLMRRDCARIISDIKVINGVEQVTLTTNGIMLAPLLPALIEAGIDAVNISLDSLSPERYARITGAPGTALDSVLAALDACCAAGVKTKVNCVLLDDTSSELISLASLAESRDIDVRFIELMPIGCGADMKRADPDAALKTLREKWPGLTESHAVRGNGPAHYYECEELTGKIGFIDAVSHKFCATCNRVRLTSAGRLKPCLCYGESTDLRALLRAGADDAALKAALEAAIYSKPRAHCFDAVQNITEKHTMSQIGG